MRNENKHNISHFSCIQNAFSERLIKNREMHYFSQLLYSSHSHGGVVSLMSFTSHTLTQTLATVSMIKCQNTRILSCHKQLYTEISALCTGLMILQLFMEI